MGPDIVKEDHSEYCLLHIKGKFDYLMAKDVRKAGEGVLRSECRYCVVDMAGTLFVDSTAVGLLMTLHKQFMAKGGSLYIVSPAPIVYNALKECGAVNVLPVKKDIDEVSRIIVTASSIEERGFYLLVKVPNVFDITVLKPLRDAIENGLEKGNKNVVFDFVKTRSVSSVGMGLLLNLQKRVLKLKGKVVLVGLSHEIHGQMAVSNVFKVIPEFSSLEDAERILL